MPDIATAYRLLYASTLVLLGIAIILQMIRAITGKLTVDKLVGINMITTTTVIVIGVLALLLGEAYLPDIMIVYVVLSFLALMLLCRFYINLYGKKKGGPKK